VQKVFPHNLPVNQGIHPLRTDGRTSAMPIVRPLLKYGQLKTKPRLFFNSSVTHWPILIIFGMWHRDEIWRKWLELRLLHFNTAATLPCEVQKS